MRQLAESGLSKYPKLQGLNSHNSMTEDFMVCHGTNGPEISKACSAFKMLGTPSHCDTAHKTTVLISRPAVFQVILKLPFHPHTPPLISFGSVLCLHSFFISSSVCFRYICTSDKNYIGVIIKCNTQINR